MSYRHMIGTLPVCDGCGKTEHDMIEIYWASGNMHYCQRCWPRHRNYYEDESGRQAWKRIGNYFAPSDAACEADDLIYRRLHFGYSRNQ